MRANEQCRRRLEEVPPKVREVFTRLEEREPPGISDEVLEMIVRVPREE